MLQDERHFTILPVRLEECGHGDHRLSIFQQVDLFKDWEVNVDKLAAYLGASVDEKSDDEKLVAALFNKAQQAQTENFLINQYGLAGLVILVPLVVK